MRQLVSSGSPFELRLGTSRTLRSGNYIAVAGTAPLKDGKTVAGDAAQQAERCFEIIQQALTQAGAALADIRPVNTVMQIGCFIDPTWLIEIEADAVIAEEE